MSLRKSLLLVLVLLEWFALIIQLVLHVQAVDLPAAEVLLRFFSYFTILGNILVAIFATSQLFSPGGFFGRASTQTAITLYIIVVGLVYNTVLRNLWDSTPLQAVIHDVLHFATPIITLIYWWFCVNAQAIRYKNIWPWLIFPAVYAITVIVAGHFTNWYPYPFLDVFKMGYPQVLLNSLALVIVFLLFAFLLVFTGKKKN